MVYRQGGNTVGSVQPIPEVTSEVQYLEVGKRRHGGKQLLRTQLHGASLSHTLDMRLTVPEIG